MVLGGDQIAGQYVMRPTVGDLTIEGAGAANARGMQLAGMTKAHFERIFVKGFSGAGSIGIELTLWDDFDGTNHVYRNTKEFTWVDVEVEDCTTGVASYNPFSPTVTYGANQHGWYNLRVSAFTRIGVEWLYGESTVFVNPKSTTNQPSVLGAAGDANAGSAAYVIDDSTCTLINPNMDFTNATNNGSMGVWVKSRANPCIIIMPSGNSASYSGPGSMGGFAPGQIRDDGPATTVIRPDYMRWAGDLPVQGTITRQYTNGGTATIAATEVCYMAGSDDLKRTDSANSPRPLVFAATKTTPVGSKCPVALPGQEVTVKCDAGAVGVGDTLVSSSTTNASARADNAIANQRFIVGYALTAKASGSVGNVRCLVK